MFFFCSVACSTTKWSKEVALFPRGKDVDKKRERQTGIGKGEKRCTRGGGGREKGK